MANETEIALRGDLVSILQVSHSIIIKDQETYDHAALLLVKTIAPFRERWSEYWEPLKKTAAAAHREVCAKFNEGDEPAERAEKAIKAEIRRWDDEQERIRQEKQREAQRAAEEKEAADRAASAAFSEMDGDLDTAEAIVSAPVAVVAEPVPETYQKITGIGKRANWKARVTDMKKLCAAIAKGQVPVNYVLANEKALNARARSDEGTMNVPGCVPYNDSIITGRAR